VARGGSLFSGGGTSVIDVSSVARSQGFANSNAYTGFGRVVLPIETPRKIAAP
jgi:hypothetical protein